MERLRRTYKNYKVFQLSKDNSFYVILGMVYIQHLVINKHKDIL
jgi:hypothetical protein